MRLLDRYAPIVVNDRDDLGSNPTDTTPIGELITARLSRRHLLQGIAAGAAAGALTTTFGRGSLAADNPSTLTFEEIEHGIDETHHVAKGYSASVLIRWGDKVFARLAGFRRQDLNAAAQERVIRLQLRLHRLYAAACRLERIRRTGFSASITNTPARS